MFATRETITEPAETPGEAATSTAATTETPLHLVPAAEAAETIAEAVSAVEQTAETPARRWRPTLGWLQGLFDVLAEPRPVDDHDQRGTRYPF